MKLRSTSAPGKTFDAELTTDHPASISGQTALKRKDTGEFIAMRDIMGVSSVKYQLLEVTPEERAQLASAGLVLAANEGDLRNWLKNWNGPGGGRERK